MIPLFKPQFCYAFIGFRPEQGETIVKFSRTAALACCVIGTGLVSAAFFLLPHKANAAQEACSAAKLSGRYVFTGQGSPVSHQANLHTGAFDFDGAGSFSAKQTSARVTHDFQHEDLHGTYTMGADCTGSLVMEGQRGGTAHWDIFVTSDGKKGRMIRTDSQQMSVRNFEQ
jgi:hypothetical protein